MRATTPHERLRLRAIIDAVVAYTYNLTGDAYGWVLRDCDHPKEALTRSFCQTLEPKGFWRVGKDQPPELRHPVLSIIAFHELKKQGLEKFLGLNEGDGWLLPETLRLADYGLGHDERAKEQQPVASVLGERLLPSQLGEDIEASWEECRRHAELIRRIIPSGEPTAPMPPVPHTEAADKAAQIALFGAALPINLVIKRTKGKKS
jgi:hypothetical protein